MNQSCVHRRRTVARNYRLAQQVDLGGRGLDGEIWDLKFLEGNNEKAYCRLPYPHSTSYFPGPIRRSIRRRRHHHRPDRRGSSPLLLLPSSAIHPAGRHRSRRGGQVEDVHARCQESEFDHEHQFGANANEERHCYAGDYYLCEFGVLWVTVVLNNKLITLYSRRTYRHYSKDYFFSRLFYS